MKHIENNDTCQHLDSLGKLLNSAPTIVMKGKGCFPFLMVKYILVVTDYKTNIETGLTSFLLEHLKIGDPGFAIKSPS